MYNFCVIQNLYNIIYISVYTSDVFYCISSLFWIHTKITELYKWTRELYNLQIIQTRQHKLLLQSVNMQTIAMKHN